MLELLLVLLLVVVVLPVVVVLVWSIVSAALRVVVCGTSSGIPGSIGWYKHHHMDRSYTSMRPLIP